MPEKNLGQQEAKTMMQSTRIQIDTILKKFEENETTEHVLINWLRPVHSFCQS